MLSSCEILARMLGFEFIYLHARLADEPAMLLYTSSGYENVDEDSWLVKLRNITPRRLMRKRLIQRNAGQDAMLGIGGVQGAL